jgi:O-antigen ligase
MDAVIAILALVGLVWGAVVFFRGGLVAGCLAVLLAGCCFGHAFFRISTPLVPLTADRLLLVVLLVQYAVYRRLGLADAKPVRRADMVLLAFIGVLFLSTFSHNWQANGSQPVARLAFFYLMPLAVYWVARQAPPARRDLLWTYGALAVFGVYLAATAIAETRGAWWAVYPQYIATSEFGEFLGRGRGPFLNPAGNGIFLGVCLCATLMWWPRVNRSGKLLLAAVAVLYCLGLYSTLTRCVWLGGVAGLFVLAGMTLPRRWSVAIVAAVSIAGVVVVATQWENILRFKRDRGLSAQAAADSVRLRPLLAAVAWEMFLDRPVFGCGFAQYMNASGDYISARSVDLPLEKVRPFVQHNVVLSLLTETGLVGAGLFVALLAFWGRDAWVLWRARHAPLWIRQQGLLFLAALAVYLPGAMFQDVSIVSMVNMLMFFLAGLTEGLVPTVNADVVEFADGSRRHEPSPRTRLSA